MFGEKCVDVLAHGNGSLQQAVPRARAIATTRTTLRRAAVRHLRTAAETISGGAFAQLRACSGSADVR